MKREGLARVSKIDVDALLDKNKSLAEGAILFPTFDVGGYHWATFAFWFLRSEKEAARLLQIRWDKFLYLDDPKVRVKSLANHARRQPRATNSGTDRRGRPLASNDSALSIRDLKA